MPIPAPKKNEGSQEFISRCMGSDMMNEEYPDQKQRAAICYSSLRKHRGGKTLLTKEKD